MGVDLIVSMIIGAVLAVMAGYFISRGKAGALHSRLQSAAEQQQKELDEQTSRLDSQLTALELARGELTENKTHLALAQQQAKNIDQQYKDAQLSIEQMRTNAAAIQSTLSEKEQSLSSMEASLDAEREKTQRLDIELERLQHELRQERVSLGDVKEKNARLLTSQQEKEEAFKNQLAQFDEQKEALKKEFENIANKIFEDKGKSFTVSSKEALNGMLNPFHEQMKEFKKRVEDIHHKDTQQQAELKTELKHLQALNQQITEEAHHLATALKGQKKMQGNWGEMILENVLDRSGLVLGKDYKREVSFSTEEGRSRPDAIVYLPEDKHLIIDAKVSLNAYTRYVNAEDEDERKQALKDHVLAVGDRIKELADRNYFDLPGINSPEMVFMFIPIESAFVEALKGDEALFQKALEQNVLVATPTTLLTSLNIVRQLWRFEDQNKHTAELAEKAAKVYDKLRGFLASMDKVGASLDRARDSYGIAYKQLYSGKANLIKQASEFQKLGVSVKAELPQELVDKADLELMNHDDEESSVVDDQDIH